MIKQVIRLVKPGLFLPCFVTEIPRPDNVIVRPRYLSICAADQRYFEGDRPLEVLRKKLPLALFHEAVAEVVHDPKFILPHGSFCVLLPGGKDSLQEESNYTQGAFFRSSNTDGFCQEILCLDRDEILPIRDENSEIYVFTELISVCCQALRRIERIKSIEHDAKFGIWGDGSLGFTMALTLKSLKPKTYVAVYGKHDEKLANFTFVDKCINIFDCSDNSFYDFAIECVGGQNSEFAIKHATAKLSPLGVLTLMGVSETNIAFPTRIILEKGLIILGTSRSVKSDFDCAMRIIGSKDIQNTLLKLISKKVTVTNASELIDVFKEEKKSPYKYIINMNL